MKKIIPLALAALLVVPCMAADDDSRLQFRVNGFSIAPLEGVSEGVVYQSLMMFLPVSDAFGPNVNVQLQSFGGSLDEYMSLSRQQFVTAGLNMLSERADGEGVTMEYTGAFQGRELHWYAKAVQAHGKIYLVTATATESQWKSVAAQLKACVDSFRIEDRG
jgi:hypothetical protein